jgi:carbamoyltransferase
MLRIPRKRQLRRGINFPLGLAQSREDFRVEFRTDPESGNVTVGRVKPAHREQFAAATLAGDLVRVHTVDKEENPLYWKLLHAAGKATGLPVLYNTSFNLFGEPLVCTPRDAVRSFYSSGIDAMFVGNFSLQK